MLSIEERLQALEDRAAIGDLIASYGPLADAGKGEELAQLWTQDGVYDIGGFGRVEGRKALGKLLDNDVHRALMEQGCAHVLSPHRIELAGDKATAIGYSVVMRRVGDAYEPWRVSANRWHLVRSNEGWRVSLRENTTLDGTVDARKLLEMPDVT